MAFFVVANLYRDSVALMRMAAEIETRAGITRVNAVMATPANRAMLVDLGIADAPSDAGPNDLLVAVEGVDERAVADAIEDARGRLQAAPMVQDRPIGAPAPMPPRSLVEAKAQDEGATLALISCSGEYATAEAMKALRLGLDVMVFSDNVSLDDEVALKREASARGLLVMGPDCGTAIIQGVPLGFANAVRRGSVGIVAASGTGLQHVACALDREGVGISEAIGTGGRDLSDEVGGITTLAAIAALDSDRETEAIAVVSKPPGPATAARVIEACAGTKKRCVICFIGASPPETAPSNVVFAANLEVAAFAAAGAPMPENELLVAIAPGRKVIGLFSGGTFCHEAQAIAATVPDNGKTLFALDLGDDAFTRGRPHPMIDFKERCSRVIEAATDPGVAAIILDVVLGTGAHPDPAAALAPAIAEARAVSNDLVFVAYVCGTEADPQRLTAQEAALAKSGVRLAPSNAAAVRAALAHAAVAGR